jgi:hypothetical protein
MKLQTGGKAGTGRMNLFCIHCAATQIVPIKDPIPIRDMDIPHLPVPPQNISINGKALGSDGNLWLTLPDGTNIDVTPVVKNVDYFTFTEPTPPKYHPYIGLTTSTTNANLETDVPEVCVGQTVTMNAYWLGGVVPPYANADIRWHLPDKYVNEQYDYSSTCMSYRQNADVLTNSAIQCWYINLPGGACSVREILTFPNGQSVNIAAKGDFTVYRPQKVGENMSQDFLNPTLNIPSPTLFATNVNISGNNNLELGDSQGGYARFWAEYNSAYPGEFQEAQIVQSYHKSGNDDPIDSGSLWWNDGAYDKIKDQGLSDSTVSLGGGIAWAMQTDQYPRLPLKAPQTVVNDIYKTYFQFKPAGDGIWVTVGRVNWSWADTATPTNVPTATVSNPQYHDDDSFPLWDAEHP